MKRLIQLPMTRPSILGAVLAVAVGLGTFMYLGERESAAPLSEIEMTTVAVATRDLGARVRVGTSDIELREVPSAGVHPLALRTVDEVVGQFTVGFTAIGEQFLPHDLSADVLGGGLAQLVPVGARAISFAISNATAAGGLVSPGDQIDVIAIFTEDTAGRDGTAIVAQNVEVLAISQVVLGDAVDTTREAAASGSPQSVSATVTVAVSLEDAQRISLAESFGDLRVFLRNPDDESEPVAVPLNLDSVARR
jgi:pilus assembly protein CpaB